MKSHNFMRITHYFMGIAALLLLTGCAGMSSIIEQRQALYAPAPINVVAPAGAAYSLAAKAAADGYVASKPGNAIAAMIDAGIVAANSNCRAWFGRLAAADQRWAQGEANLNVAENAVTAILGATKAASSVVAGYGVAATALSGYNGAFQASVLGMADGDLQAKVREIMTARAAEMRAGAAGLTYPQAIDQIEDYAQLCTTQAAKAAARSAMTATTATATAAGTVQSVAKP